MKIKTVILAIFLLSTLACGQTTILISVANPSLVTVSLPNATQAVAYSQTLNATGGTGTGYRYTIISTTQPPTGISLNGSTGVISGTTSAAVATYPFTVIVTDSALGASAPVALSIQVVAGGITLVVDTLTLTDATVNTAYSKTLSAHGGTGTGYTWSTISGSLPTGLSLSSGGVISGTPTVVVSAQAFTVRVTDSGANHADQALTLNVNPASGTCGPPSYPCSVTDSGSYPPTSGTTSNFNNNAQGNWAGHNGGPYGAGMVAYIHVAMFRPYSRLRCYQGGWLQFPYRMV